MPLVVQKVEGFSIRVWEPSGSQTGDAGFTLCACLNFAACSRAGRARPPRKGPALRPPQNGVKPAPGRVPVPVCTKAQFSRQKQAKH